MEKKVRTRLYLAEAGASSLQCKDSETLGICKTLRLAETEQVAVFNGDGREYLYGIDNSTRSSLSIRLLDSSLNSKDPLQDIWVYIAATKGKARDRMVRDLPPLGVTKIFFYQAERSIAKLDSEQDDRLQKIVIEACRQCGRSTIPSVNILEKPLSGLLEENYFPPEQSLFFWEGEEEFFHKESLHNRSAVFLVFGPEGGFSPEEVNEMKKHNLPTMGLGPRILRTELAVVVGVTLFSRNEQNSI